MRARNHVRGFVPKLGAPAPLAALSALALAVALTLTTTLRGANADGPTLRPGGTPVSGGLYVLAGSLHDHSTDSDGDASSEDVAAWEYAHRAELGIDFAALTDHADFLPFAYLAPFSGNVWKKQAQLAARWTHDGFVFLRGFEYTSDQENHVGVIGSSGFLGGIRHNDDRMDSLYDWVAHNGTRAGVLEFNHPSSKGALQWDNLHFDPTVAANVGAIEIYGDQGFTERNLTHSDGGWYWLALTRGWTIAPVMNWDTHHWREKFAQPDIGEHCGDVPRTLPCQRTLILAEAANPDAIMRALRARRVSATEHPSLWATLRGPGGVWQGGTIASAQDETVELTVEAGSSLWPLSKVDIVSDNGIDPHPYFDGDNPACTIAPDLCADDSPGASPIAASYIEQHQRYVRSRGHALRKDQIDGPPPEAVVASIPLEGHRALQSITVRIPSNRSLRPDGKHFFYAIVWAGVLRSWTSPIFTESSVRYADRSASAIRNRR